MGAVFIVNNLARVLFTRSKKLLVFSHPDILIVQKPWNYWWVRHGPANHMRCLR